MRRDPFAPFVAFRYLRGAEGTEEGRRFLRFVTYAAIGGVAIGVAALLLALTIVRGFGAEIEEKIVGFGAHVQVSHIFEQPLADADSLAARLLTHPGVIRVSPAVIDLALLRTPDGIEGVALNGTRSDHHPFLSDRIQEGDFTFAADTSGRPGVVIGRRLATLLGAEVGQNMIAFATRAGTPVDTEEAPPAPAFGLVPGGVAPPSGGGALGARPRVRQFHLAGIYETGLADFDELNAFVDIDEARTLFGMAADEATRLDLTLADIDDSRAVAREIGVELGMPLLVRSVFDVFASLFAWIELQRSIVPLVISVIVFVAAFNVIGTLLMVILEKSGQIGILISMGASAAMVRRLFLWLGFCIGVIGSAIGAGGALLFAVLQARFAIIPLPQEAYYLDRAPVELNALDFVLVVSVAVLLSVAAAYFPARAAARIEPVRAIRFAG
ncbi:ABC transporter permease [soil metagenome]